MEDAWMQHTSCLTTKATSPAKQGFKHDHACQRHIAATGLLCCALLLSKPEDPQDGRCPGAAHIVADHHTNIN